MSPPTSRRALLRRSLVATSTLVAGCATPSTGENDSRWGDARWDLSIYNRTATGRRLSVTIVEVGEPADPEALPRTLTATTSDRSRKPAFQSEFRVDADGDDGVSDLFAIPDEPIEYRVYVRLDDGATASYAFEAEPHGGFASLDVTITSGSNVRFGQAFV